LRYVVKVKMNAKDNIIVQQSFSFAMWGYVGVVMGFWWELLLVEEKRENVVVLDVG